MHPKHKIIFIHALFRTGSTYFWSVLKNNKNAVCYYEPLNEQLLSELDFIDENSIEKIKHSGLVENYYSEYVGTKKRLKFFKEKMIADEFCKVKSDENLRGYVDCLTNFHADKTSIFHFNRTSLRSKWFVDNYPGSLNIYLHRDYKDQWQSIVDQYHSDNPYFIIMNLMFFFKNQSHKFFKPLTTLIHCPEMPRFICENESLLFQSNYNHVYPYAYYLTMEEHYLIHYYLWKLSHAFNEKYCNLCVDMTKLNNDPLYQEKVSNVFSAYSEFKPNFKKIKLPRYSALNLSVTTVMMIESLAEEKLKEVIHQI